MMSHTRLFVGNVPENIGQDELQKAFSSYGQIISVDLKTKSNPENDQKKFAFITLSGSNYEIESCIKHFSSEDFGGSRLYVTRARESFLERLQRERNEAQNKEALKKEHNTDLPKKNPVLKLGEKLNPRKRKLSQQTNEGLHHHHQPITANEAPKTIEIIKPFEKKKQTYSEQQNGFQNDSQENGVLEKDKKKLDADKKRMESMKKKRQEFRQKQMIIKTGLVGVDKVPNKKVKFSDDEDTVPQKLKNGIKTQESVQTNNVKNSLFDDNESDDDVNFEIKKQFEGKKGQKVLDLQSRYKSDKRFVLDERFVDDGPSDDENKAENDDDDRVDLGEADEKSKQLNILQGVLGVTIKQRPVDSESRKAKSRPGMLRFDPSQPDHAKFLAPVEDLKQESNKKSKKKKKDKQQEQMTEEKVEHEIEKVEVSKEQFYKVSETLKETLEKPITFSLRSMFAQNEDNEKEAPEKEPSYIPLKKSTESKVKNPLDPSGRNPFVYDSSDSEEEEEKEVKNEVGEAQPVETKAVWRENLFFSKLDKRLLDGLAFFNELPNNDARKERRELKSVMKKRIYNKERKNQMFQKKIGGRKKMVKKNFRGKRN